MTLSTSATSQRGLLDPTQNDIHCLLMGGPDYKLNYTSASCRARQLSATCTNKKCERRVNLVRPNLVQTSVATQKHEADHKEPGVNKVSCGHCGKLRVITGRGLCARCAKELRAAGTLDALFPSKQGQRTDIKPKRSEVKVVDKKPTTINKQPNDVKFEVVFGERDKGLLATLKKSADIDRRTVTDQILIILDNYLEDNK